VMARSACMSAMRARHYSINHRISSQSSRSLCCFVSDGVHPGAYLLNVVSMEYNFTTVRRRSRVCGRVSVWLLALITTMLLGMLDTR